MSEQQLNYSYNTDFTMNDDKELPAYIYDKIIGFSDLSKSHYWQRFMRKKKNSTGLVDFRNAFIGTVFTNQWQGKLNEAKIRNNWRLIAGDTVSMVTKPQNIIQKRLVILVKDNTWAGALKLQKHTLIDRINQFLEMPLINDFDIKIYGQSANTNTSSNARGYKYYRRKRV